MACTILDTLQATEQEMERVHPSLTHITTLQQEYQELAEESALDEAKESLEVTKKRWQDTIERVAERQRHLVVSYIALDCNLVVRQLYRLT